VLALRARQIRNFLATLFLSQGVPMLLAGDEMGHSQRGNNNAYCQDNETTWIDWRLLECSAGTVRFVRRLSDLRRSRLWLRRDTFLKGTQRQAGSRDIAWLHPSGREMTERDWNDASLRCLALHMTGATNASLGPGGDVLAVFNADSGPVDLVLPEPVHGRPGSWCSTPSSPTARPSRVLCGATKYCGWRRAARFFSSRLPAQTPSEQGAAGGPNRRPRTGAIQAFPVLRTAAVWWHRRPVSAPASAPRRRRSRRAVRAHRGVLSFGRD